jgi:DNA-binding winged helix-turn-helix (wHTH) protein
MQVRFGDFVLDTDTREVTRQSVPVHLPPKAFQLLELLVAAYPRALAKDTLYHRLWPETFVVETNLPNLVGDLRVAIGDDPRQPRFVRTVHGFGYAFREAPRTIGNAGERSRMVLYQLVWKGGRETFSEGEHVLGRDPSLELCVDSASVSRRHARLRIDGGEVLLEDLGSKNGTFVNGQRVARAVTLSDRDQLRVGSIRLTFRVLSAQSSTETIAGG